MGEDAFYRDKLVKIGTCEEMYYLRAEQAQLVRRAPNSLDVNDDVVRFALRFRFPWPDEDTILPGEFEKAFDRGHGLYKLAVPDEVEHRGVQFKTDHGYLLSVPCPESEEGREALEKAGLKVHKNGWRGDVEVNAQKWLKADASGPERLCTICRCGGCGAKYRLETYEMALPVIEACRKQGDPTHQNAWQRDTWWDGVADRIAAGYEGKFR